MASKPYRHIVTGRRKKHCAYHPGTRLIQGFDEKGGYVPGILQCPLCGNRYTSETPAPAEEGLKSKHGQTKSKIISPRTKKKRYYDKQGHEINDPDLIQIARQGGNIISYHEEKQGEGGEYHVIKK